MGQTLGFKAAKMAESAQKTELIKGLRKRRFARKRKVGSYLHANYLPTKRLTARLQNRRSQRRSPLSPSATLSRRYEAVPIHEDKPHSLNGIEMTEIGRVDWKLAPRGSTAQRRDSTAAWIHSSQCVSARLSMRRGVIRGLRKDGKRTHDWTKKDYAGVLALALFVLGSVFIICMLSWANNESVPLVVQASITSFCQDVFVRILAVVFTEYVITAPLCLCICLVATWMMLRKKTLPCLGRFVVTRAGLYHPLVLRSDEKGLYV